MVRINENYDKLSGGYLFSEITRKTRGFQQANPKIKVMKLGVGNTTEPLTKTVINGLHNGVSRLGFGDTYTGYGDEQGNERLRTEIANQYRKEGVEVNPHEVFVSDGAKPDSANIQSIFSLDASVAVQDPAYTVYVDTNVIAGRAGEFNKEVGLYDRLIYMPCTEENGFFPDLPMAIPGLIYLNSPNNPTGSVATKEQLKTFVDFAREYKAAIIFDAAYSAYISNPDLPRSIYEIHGARECAIEINSFSKDNGFTGARLGWTIVPTDLIVEDTEFGKINKLWNRRQSTFFNGASNIVQAGGLAALTEQGQRESQEMVEFYMGNAKIIKDGLESLGLTVFGGVNAPYLWLRTPNRMGSWDFFDKLLNETHVVGTPGIGFGPSGREYFRLSAFGHREDIEEAVDSIKNNLKL